MVQELDAFCLEYAHHSLHLVEAAHQSRGASLLYA
jgi:hypothetical protein